MKSTNAYDKTRDHVTAPGFVLTGWLLSLCLVMAMMIIIFRFSAAHATDSSRLSQGICRRLIETFLKMIPGLFTGESLKEAADLIETPVRKLAHFSEYTLLGFLMINHLLFVGRLGRLRHKNLLSARKNLLISIGICVFYAASDEFHQLFVPGRACRILDVLIDSSGVLFGTFLFSLILWRLLDAVFGKGYN